MHIVCVGLDHSTAPVEIRECVAFSGERLLEASLEFCSSAKASQAAILSTCNRTEVYAAGPRPLGEQLKQWLVARANGQGSELASCLYEFGGREAAKHLCNVAAGVESQVVGEAEILGQVKAAMQAARGAGTLGPELEKLFLIAVRSGKRTRSETAIGRGAFSVGRCAVEAAKGVLGELRGRTILIMGAGKIAETTARHLFSQGAGTILVANRTFARAQELARDLGGQALRYDQIAQGLKEADIVITSTAAPHYVLLPEHVEDAVEERNGREMFLVDIAVPRNIDPRVAAIPGVQLCDIDHLDGGVRSAEVCRADEVEAARTIASEEAEEFCRWLAARAAVPLLGALRDQYEQARQETLTRFAGRLDRLGSEERDLVQRVTLSLIKRLLHSPTVNLKHELALGNGKAADLLARMYGLDAVTCEKVSSPSPSRKRKRSTSSNAGETSPSRDGAGVSVEAKEGVVRRVSRAAAGARRQRATGGEEKRR